MSWHCYTLKRTLSVIMESETNWPNGSGDKDKLWFLPWGNSGTRLWAVEVWRSNTSAATTPVQNWPNFIEYYKMYNWVHKQSNLCHWMMRVHTECAHSLPHAVTIKYNSIWPPKSRGNTPCDITLIKISSQAWNSESVDRNYQNHCKYKHCWK